MKAYHCVMNPKSILRLAATLIVLALSASAQIDATKFAADLRAKYGPPLAREVFAVPPGIEMAVDYAANGHICRIQLPPVAPGRHSAVKTAQGVDEFLVELIPPAMRGKELGRTMMAVGAPSASMIAYENVAIVRSFHAGVPSGITVTFPHEECHDRPAQ